MPFVPFVRCRDVDEAIAKAKHCEHGFRHTSIIHSNNVRNMTKMGRALDTTLFVKNGPCMAALGLGGEGYLSFSIAGADGRRRHHAADVHPRTPLLDDRRFADFGERVGLRSGAVSQPKWDGLAIRPGDPHNWENNMHLARVIGTATATVKHPSLRGREAAGRAALLADGRTPDGDPLLAVDVRRRRRGETVMITSDGRYAREWLKTDTTPVRWTTIGIQGLMAGQELDVEAIVREVLPPAAAAERRCGLPTWTTRPEQSSQPRRSPRRRPPAADAGRNCSWSIARSRWRLVAGRLDGVNEVLVPRRRRRHAGGARRVAKAANRPAPRRRAGGRLGGREPDSCSAWPGNADPTGAAVAAVQAEAGSADRIDDDCVLEVVRQVAQAVAGQTRIGWC